MDDKTKELEQVKGDYIDKQKRLALLEAGVGYDDTETYVKYITADEKREIERQASELVEDIKRQNTAKPDVFHDPRSFSKAWNPFD